MQSTDFLLPFLGKYIPEEFHALRGVSRTFLKEPFFFQGVKDTCYLIAQCIAHQYPELVSCGELKDELDSIGQQAEQITGFLKTFGSILNNPQQGLYESIRLGSSFLILLSIECGADTSRSGSPLSESVSLPSLKHDDFETNIKKWKVHRFLCRSHNQFKPRSLKSLDSPSLVLKVLSKNLTLSSLRILTHLMKHVEFEGEFLFECLQNAVHQDKEQLVETVLKFFEKPSASCAFESLKFKCLKGSWKIIQRLLEWFVDLSVRRCREWDGSKWSCKAALISADTLVLGFQDLSKLVWWLCKRQDVHHLALFPPTPVNMCVKANNLKLSTLLLGICSPGDQTELLEQARGFIQDELSSFETSPCDLQYVHVDFDAEKCIEPFEVNSAMRLYHNKFKEGGVKCMDFLLASGLLNTEELEQWMTKLLTGRKHSSLEPFEQVLCSIQSFKRGDLCVFLRAIDHLVKEQAFKLEKARALVSALMCASDQHLLVEFVLANPVNIQTILDWKVYESVESLSRLDLTSQNPEPLEFNYWLSLLCLCCKTEKLMVLNKISRLCPKLTQIPEWCLVCLAKLQCSKSLELASKCFCLDKNMISSLKLCLMGRFDMTLERMKQTVLLFGEFELTQEDVERAIASRNPHLIVDILKTFDPTLLSDHALNNL